MSALLCLLAGALPWGAANLFAGLLIAWRWLVTAEFNAGLVALVLGFVAAGTSFLMIAFAHPRASQ